MKLNKLLTLALLLIGLNITSYALDDGGNKIGVRAGYSVSNISEGFSITNGQNLNSFYVGVFREQRIVPFMHLGSGLEYAQLGYDDNNTLKLHYLSIPVNLKFKIGPFYALAGASASFKVNEEWTTENATSTSLTKASWFDVPLHLGGGIRIMALRIEVRYHWGTMDLYNTVGNSSKTQALQLGLAIAI